MTSSRTRTEGRNRLRAVAVWAMLPLAMINGRLQAGCICPNGQFSSQCRAASCPGNGAASETSATGCCGCSCCTQSDNGSHECCQKQSHKSSHGNSVPREGRLSQRGCVPAFEVHTTPVVLTDSIQLDDVEFVAFATISPANDQPSNGLLNGRVHSDSDPPPGDIVIRLHRLVI